MKEKSMTSARFVSSLKLQSPTIKKNPGAADTHTQANKPYTRSYVQMGYWSFSCIGRIGKASLLSSGTFWLIITVCILHEYFDCYYAPCYIDFVPAVNPRFCWGHCCSFFIVDYVTALTHKGTWLIFKMAASKKNIISTECRLMWIYLSGFGEIHLRFLPVQRCRGYKHHSVCGAQRLENNTLKEFILSMCLM